MMNRVASFAWLFPLWLVCMAQAQNTVPKTIKHPLKRIVIDPGHGGSPAQARNFYGASGKHMEEKDVALAVGLKMEKILKAEMPDVDIYLTRTTDEFNSPIVKANKANAIKGDLFISIHCNDVSPIRHSEIVGYTTKTTKRKGKKITKKVPEYRIYYTPNPAKGTETYIWGVGKTRDKEEALRENNFSDTAMLAAFDEKDPAVNLINSMRTSGYAQRSRKLAETIEEEFVNSGRVSRGAKQRNERGIWVLQAVAMPAVLVEVGFLSNPEEEEYITSEQGQQEIAESVIKAIKRYRVSLEAQVNGIPAGK